MHAACAQRASQSASSHTFVRTLRLSYLLWTQFLSLTQKGPNGEARSEPDAALFGHSLRNMMVWYSHPKILTLKLTTLPPGYPDGFDFPLDITPNTASYFDRGW